MSLLFGGFPQQMASAIVAPRSVVFLKLLMKIIPIRTIFLIGPYRRRMRFSWQSFQR
jgi:hypothetical protein